MCRCLLAGRRLRQPHGATLDVYGMRHGEDSTGIVPVRSIAPALDQDQWCINCPTAVLMGIVLVALRSRVRCL